MTLAIVAGAFAQNDLDAFRFSQTNWEGTARFMGAGGAFSAIGGDFSCLNTNPAGIGVFINNARTVWIDYPAVYAAIFLVIIVGVIMEYGVFLQIEKATIRKWGMVR